MPDSTTVATVFPPAASAASRTFSCLFSPTRFHEDPLFLSPLSTTRERRRIFLFHPELSRHAARSSSKFVLLLNRDAGMGLFSALELGERRTLPLTSYRGGTANYFR